MKRIYDFSLSLKFVHTASSVFLLRAVPFCKFNISYLFYEYG